MEDLNFSQQNIKNEKKQQSNGGENLDSEKLTKIIFDWDQLNFIKFRLSFVDGLLFGLGIIASWAVVSIIIFIVVTVIGVSFSSVLFRGLI